MAKSSVVVPVVSVPSAETVIREPTKTGVVPKTKAPVPVSPVTAAAICDDVATSVLLERFSVLFVSVCVFAAVRTLLGVMMPDRVAMIISSKLRQV